MKITDSIIRRPAKPSRGFSLIEILLAAAVLSMVVAVGIFAVSSILEPSRELKLKSDVAKLNGAVKAYLVHGGKFPDAASGEEVLAQLKTVADTGSRAKLAGLRGSMIDRRLQGVPAGASGPARAAWNRDKMLFEITTSGSGFREFDLGANDSSPAAGAARGRMLDLATRDRWIWDSQDTAMAREPARAAQTRDVLPEEAGAPVSIIQLAAPDFSMPGAVYDFSAFSPVLDVSLIDRNKPGSAQVLYSINGGGWQIYKGTLQIPPDLLTVVRAYAVPLNTQLFESSEIITQQYETIYFTGDSKGQFHSPAGDEGLVTNLAPGAADSLFAWGSPATEDKKQNELDFRGDRFSKVAPDEEFKLGTLSYYNGTTYSNTNATSVQITVDLNLSTPAAKESLNFEFRLLSTPNKGADADADADYVWIPDVSSNFRTTVKGRTFALVLRFGDHSQNGFTTIDSFHTHEGKLMQGTVYGRLTEVR